VLIRNGGEEEVAEEVAEAKSCYCGMLLWIFNNTKT